MSVVSNFKFGPHLRPVVDTCLWLLNNSCGQEQGIINTLGPKLTPELLAQVKGVFSKSLQHAQEGEEPPQKRVKLTHDAQVVEASYRNAVQMIEREIEVVSSCRPNANASVTLRRAEARAFERVFFAQSGFRLLRERTVYFQGVSSFLNMRDLLCSVACISPEMNCSVSQLHPQIWQGFAETFSLPKEIYWSEYSKQAVKENFLRLRDIQLVFRAFGQDREARETLSSYAQLPAILTQNEPSDPRRFFREGLLPVISAVMKRDETDDAQLPAEYVKNCIQDLSFTTGRDIHSQPFFIYEAFFASGICDDDLPFVSELFELLYQQLCRYSDAATQKTIVAAAQRAVDLLEKRDGLSQHMDKFLNRPHLIAAHFMPLFLRLIEEGIDCTGVSIYNLLWKGGIALLEPLVEQAGVKVYRDEIRALLDALLHTAPRLKTGAEMLAAIECVVKHAVDREEGVAVSMVNPLVTYDLFYAMAKYCHDPLMEKLIQLGFRPDNSNTPKNSLHIALSDKPRISSYDVFHEEWATGASVGVIATLVRHGATIDALTATDLIYANYAGRPSMQDEIFKLFS